MALGVLFLMSVGLEILKFRFRHLKEKRDIQEAKIAVQKDRLQISIERLNIINDELADLSWEIMYCEKPHLNPWPWLKARFNEKV